MKNKPFMLAAVFVSALVTFIFIGSPSSLPEQVISSFDFTARNRNTLECVNYSEIAPSLLQLTRGSNVSVFEVAINGAVNIDLNNLGFADGSVISAEVLSTDTNAALPCWLVADLKRADSQDIFPLNPPLRPITDVTDSTKTFYNLSPNPQHPNLLDTRYRVPINTTSQESKIRIFRTLPHSMSVQFYDAQGTAVGTSINTNPNGTSNTRSIDTVDKNFFGSATIVHENPGFPLDLPPESIHVERRLGDNDVKARIQVFATTTTTTTTSTTTTTLPPITTTTTTIPVINLEPPIPADGITRPIVSQNSLRGNITRIDPLITYKGTFSTKTNPLHLYAINTYTLLKDSSGKLPRDANLFIDDKPCTFLKEDLFQSIDSSNRASDLTKFCFVKLDLDINGTVHNIFLQVNGTNYRIARLQLRSNDAAIEVRSPFTRINRFGSVFYFTVRDNLNLMSVNNITINGKPCPFLTLNSAASEIEQDIGENPSGGAPLSFSGSFQDHFSDDDGRRHFACKLSTEDLYDFATKDPEKWKNAEINIGSYRFTTSIEDLPIHPHLKNENVENRVVEEIRSYFNIDTNSSDQRDRLNKGERWMSTNKGSLFLTDNHKQVHNLNLFFVSPDESNIENPVSLIRFPVILPSTGSAIFYSSSRISFYNIFSKIKGITTFDPSRIEVIPEGIVGIGASNYTSVKKQSFTVNNNKVTQGNSTSICTFNGGLNENLIPLRYNNVFKRGACTGLSKTSLNVLELQRGSNTDLLYLRARPSLGIIRINSEDYFVKILPVPPIYKSILTADTNALSPTATQLPLFVELGELMNSLTVVDYLPHPKLAITIDNSPCLLSSKIASGCIAANLNRSITNHNIVAKFDNKVVTSGNLKVTPFNVNTNNSYNFSLSGQNNVLLVGNRHYFRSDIPHIKSIQFEPTSGGATTNPVKCDVSTVNLNQLDNKIFAASLGSILHPDTRCVISRSGFEHLEEGIRVASIETVNGQIIQKANITDSESSEGSVSRISSVSREFIIRQSSAACRFRFNGFCYREFEFPFEQVVNYTSFDLTEDPADTCEKACEKSGGFKKDFMTYANCKELATRLNNTIPNSTATRPQLCQKAASQRFSTGQVRVNTVFTIGNYSDNRRFPDPNPNGPNYSPQNFGQKEYCACRF